MIVDALVKEAKEKDLVLGKRLAMVENRAAEALLAHGARAQRECLLLVGALGRERRPGRRRVGSSAGGGSVAGIGYVEGVRCVVTASNSAIKGGTVAPSGQRKGQRVTTPDHLPPQAQWFFARDRQWLDEQASEVGPHCQQVIDWLLGYAS